MNRSACHGSEIDYYLSSMHELAESASKMLVGLGTVEIEANTNDIISGKLSH